MKNGNSRWAKLMVIGAFGALLLSIGTGPTEVGARVCEDCEDDGGGGGGPPPPPPPPPSCNYDQQTTTDVTSFGVGRSLLVQRGTVKTSHVGFCSNVCPNASYSWQGPGYCDCYLDTIPQLRAAGVETWEIHRTRYAIWSPPSLTVANTRTLLVALAGQNGVSSGGSSGGGGPGNTTGQPNHWLDACDDEDCGTQVFSGTSFVGRLLSAPPYMNINRDNTFAVSFLDHQYDWTSPYRAAIRHGLFQWLKTKVNPTYLKQIIIAGHSRGGCLTLGLIKEFRDDPAFDAVRILGAPVDGTCQDGENGTLAWFNDIDNPLTSALFWHGWRSNFSLANNQKVCIQNTVGGEAQVGPANVHSFYLTNSAWNNSWMTIPHAICGQCSMDSVDRLSGGECIGGGSFNVKTEVVDRALRFVQMNRVP